jgi:tetratricopeptide (TPR) repeat protein
MKTPLVQPAAPTPTASVSEFIATFAIILASIAGLLLFDTALARIDSRERRTYAAREFATGERLMSEKRTEEAIQHLRSATSLDADNPAYATALADAVLADARPRDAELILAPVLERAPRNGVANLTMARVLAKENRIDEAKSYYHSAIYGIWPAGAASRRLGARFELIDLLARTNDRELLAELLPIQDDSTNDGDHRKLIAHLFVQAGSPARAVTIFRDFLRKNPGDVDAYVGLADAALSLGDLATGRADLVAAQKLLPDTTAMKKRISVIDSAVALDPTQTGLALAEQSRRARVLLQMTVDAVQHCLGKQAPDVAPALDSIRPMLLSHAPAEGQAQSIEQTISVAEQLWGLRRSRCAPGPDDTPLALVHNRIAH